MYLYQNVIDRQKINYLLLFGYLFLILLYSYRYNIYRLQGLFSAINRQPLVRMLCLGNQTIGCGMFVGVLKFNTKSTVRKKIRKSKDRGAILRRNMEECYIVTIVSCLIDKLNLCNDFTIAFVNFTLRIEDTPTLFMS